MSWQLSNRHRLARWWTWLVLATVLVAVLVALRYVTSSDPAGSVPNSLLRAFSVAGQVSTLSALVMLPVLVLALLLPRPRLVLPAGVVVSTLLLLFLLLDGEVYALYRFHLNAGVLQLLLGVAGSQIFVFSAAMYLQAGAIALAMLALQWFVAVRLWRRSAPAAGRWLRGRHIAVALLALVLPYQLGHAWADAVGYTPLTRDAAMLPLSYPFRARGLLRHFGLETQREQWQFSSDATGLSYPLQAVSCNPPQRRPDILFIVIDSWRFDTLDQTVTPRIWQFAAGAARFTQHFSGGNATRAGIFSLFYGIPATYWQDMLRNHQGPVFISALQQAGYQIGVFQSASLRSPEFHETIFSQVKEPRLESDGDTPAARDRDLTGDFERFLDERDRTRPYFAFLFYDAPHAYDFPADFPLVFTPSLAEVNYLALGRDTDPLPFFNRYRNSVHYVDTLVGEVLDRLQAGGGLDDSVVLVTGDHGQEFNDNGLGYWGHNSNFTRYQIQVPLLLHAPDVLPGTHDYRSSHFDVVPTLMARYLGCSTPSDRYSVGHDLFHSGGRDELVIGSYQDFAVVGPGQIVSVRKTGLSVFDDSGRPAPSDSSPGAAMSVALEQNSRFRRHAGGGGWATDSFLAAAPDWKIIHRLDCQVAGATTGVADVGDPGTGLFRRTARQDRHPRNQVRAHDGRGQAGQCQARAAGAGAHLDGPSRGGDRHPRAAHPAAAGQ